MQAEPSARTRPDERPQPDVRAADDDTLLRLARAGATSAFGELYTRHRSAALHYARSLARRSGEPGAADDILAEAVRKVLSAMDAGAGPVTDFRRYLFTSVRSAAVARLRARRRTLNLECSPSAEDRSQDVVDMIVAGEAFQSLPRRWQHILWATSVDQLTPTELAPVLGMRPNSVAVLAHRARTAFRSGYLSGS